ncbi:hypothetical protein PCI56_27300 [Plesiomonas shigelloides subsp. oncorhynchi]|nr:hypothetical protein [Plesiomonas shigelloides]
MQVLDNISFKIKFMLPMLVAISIFVVLSGIIYHSFTEQHTTTLALRQDVLPVKTILKVHIAICTKSLRQGKHWLSAVLMKKH